MKKIKKSDTRKCSCGNDKFAAHQRCYHDVIVNSRNSFDEDLRIYESEHPYGPYTCMVCGTQYEELDELDRLPKGGDGGD